MQALSHWDKFVDRWLPESAVTQAAAVPIEFAEFARRCRIRSGKQLIPFELYDYQIELSRLIDGHRGAIIYKTRQMGITETIAAKFLHKACLNPAYAAVVLSIGQDESFNVSDRIKLMPQFPGFKWGVQSKKQLWVQNGGKIYFRPSTDNAGRSLESISDVLLDEAAFPANIEELYSSATPAQEMVGDAAKTLIVSTMAPAGRLTWFWQMFDSGNGDIDADRMVARVREGWGDGFEYWIDDSGWAKIICHWRSHPIYSQVPDYLAKIRREKKLSEEKLQREYNLGLPEVGGALFNGVAIDQGAIGIWQPPQPQHRYLIGVDPNFGGSDYFVVQVWDITIRPYALVAQYREAQRSPTYSQGQLLMLIDTYQPVITAIESNSGGAILLEWCVSQRPQLRFEGVKTTAQSKIVNTDRLALALTNSDVIYPIDWVGIDEMKRFLALDRRAMAGWHDDTVMAWAAAWAWLDAARSTETGPIEFYSSGRRSSQSASWH